MVKIYKNIKTAQELKKLKLPIARIQGNKKIISRSNIINKIATK